MQDYTLINDDEIFIDRDGPVFEKVVNYLRHGRIYNDEEGGGLKALKAEAEYFQLDELSQKIDRMMTDEAPNMSQEETFIIMDTNKITSLGRSIDGGEEGHMIFEDSSAYYHLL